MIRLIGISSIAFMIALLPAGAHAQGRTPATDSAAIGGDVGLFRPASDALEPAVSLDAFYEYYLSPRSSLRLGGGWTAPEYAFEPDERLRHIRIGGDLIYNWEGGAVHPFVGAGLGVYILEPRERGNAQAESEARLGGVLLGGLEFFLDRTTAVKTEVSYHLISNVDHFGPRNPDGLKLAIGMKKYF